MKKLTTLVLAAGLVVSSFAGASAGEFVPNAQFVNSYTAYSTQNIGRHENFEAATRIQLGFDYVASENLSGTFLIRVQENYGTGEFDSQWANNAIKVRLAYIDWIIPSTDVQVRMGYQPIALPAFAFGSAVLDGRGAGVTINAPINENISIAANWTRLGWNGDYFDEGAWDGEDYIDNGGKDDADMFTIMADFNYDGFRVAPWVSYAMLGSNAPGSSLGDFGGAGLGFATGGFRDADVWLLGASFELSMFDPFVFALDTYYSNISASGVAPGVEDSQDGYYVGAALSYKTDFGTPALKGWYATGHDENGAKKGESGLFYLAPCFAATSIMFDNYVMGLSGPTELANGASPAGTWGILLQWEDFSFVDKLSHTAIFAYMQGTNSMDLYGLANRVVEGNYLSNLAKDDSVIEVNFNTTYQIYKNLSTTLQLGWLSPDFDEVIADTMNDDIWRAAWTFTYNF